MIFKVMIRIRCGLPVNPYFARSRSRDHVALPESYLWHSSNLLQASITPYSVSPLLSVTSVFFHQSAKLYVLLYHVC